MRFIPKDPLLVKNLFNSSFASGGEGGGAIPLVFLFDDQFITPDDDPATSPRTAEPGPGILTDEFGGVESSISGGELIYGPHAVSAWKMWSSEAVPTSNLGIFFRGRTAGDYSFVAHSDPTSAFNYGHFFLNQSPVGPVRCYYAAGSYIQATTKGSDINREYWLIKSSDGAVGFWVINGVLEWINMLAVPGADTRISLAKYHNVTQQNCARFSAVDMATSGYTKWGTQYGTADHYAASPVEGESVTAPRDAILDLTIDTLPTNLLSNPGFETAGAAPPVFEDWPTDSEGGSINDETTIVKSGSHSLKLIGGVAANTTVKQTTFPSGFEVDGVVALSADLYSLARADGYPDVFAWLYGDNYGMLLYGPVSTGVWEYKSALYEKTAGSANFYVACRETKKNTGNTFIFDNIALSEPVVREFWKTDDANKWHLTVDSNGRPVIYERVAGTDTPRIIGADNDHTPGDAVRIIHFYDSLDSKYKVYLYCGTNFAGTIATETVQSGRLATVKQAGAGSAISHSAIYKRDQSGNVPNMG